MNKKLLLLVGHGIGQNGRYDPGACFNGYEEFKIAKEIASFAADALLQYPCDVELKNYDGTMSLFQRIAYANESHFDLVVEFHLNAGGGTGTECYYPSEDPEGKMLAEAICNAISSTLGIKNRGAKTKLTSQGADYFAILRETKATTLIIETCFLDTDDIYQVDTRGKQKRVGTAIAKTIADKLNFR